LTAPAKLNGPSTAREWAARITASWRASVEAILEVGRLLATAKEALPHGEFGKMIEADLPFGDRTARMLMTIAADPRLSDRKHASVLPPHWGTMYELTKLDDHEFGIRVADGTICADMERRDIATVVKAASRSTHERELGEKQMALPRQKFGVIVADPPWRFEPWSRTTGLDRAADNHYPTACAEVIASLDVPSIAADDCVLFLWATVPMLPHSLLVMDVWGFEYRSHFVWVKDRTGTGYWNRNSHELLLIGVKGKPPAPAPGTQYASAQQVKISKHSAKPEWFLELIEDYFPTLPKIELNRRGPPRVGWSSWGNEAEQPTTESATAATSKPPGPDAAAAPEPAPFPIPSGAGSPFPF
jgi:N6-adenosine-specific RNA methylase IME4